MSTQILTVSSKGQISLPVSIRKRLSIGTGDKLVAYTSGDVIMLKTLKLPSAEEFEASLNEAQKWAMSVGYNENDVDDIIQSVRKKKPMEK
ncbi:MAG: AbrB/MazE/SpoVT family DNA-binding domain-containing protein [Blautia sp.]|nr:AbrB/MazE/SpoVT family DNA-binding domain-containing protein [Blautia sp.]